MDVREKLVELQGALGKSVVWGYDDVTDTDYINYEETAKNLIANGVTVQEWISVKDRLPEKPMKCLVYTKRGEYGGYEITYYNEGFYLQYANVTHWMPLPDEPEVKND